MIGGAASVSPQDAQSNLGAWAELIGLDWLAALISPEVNDIIFWFAVIALLVSIAWFWGPDYWKQIMLGQRRMIGLAIAALLLFSVIIYSIEIPEDEKPNWDMTHPSLSLSEQEVIKAKCEMLALENINEGRSLELARNREKYKNACLVREGFIHSDHLGNNSNLSTENKNLVVGDPVDVRAVTQEEYDSLVHKDGKTLYIIKD